MGEIYKVSEDATGLFSKPKLLREKRVEDVGLFLKVFLKARILLKELDTCLRKYVLSVRK